MLIAIIALLGAAVWLVSDIEFQTYGYVVGDPDAE
jgi:hypothetical protein